MAVFIIIALSFWSIKPLLTPGFFTMHDDTQIARVIEMGKALKNGQFPVRWVADLGYGYGYPIFNFYGPFPYYIGSLFYLLGFSGLIATKIMFILGIMLAGLSMYLLSSSLLGRFSGIISSVLYVYAPYHAVDIYVRGAVGEFWSFVFLPLLLWGLFQAHCKDTKGEKAMLIGSVSLAGVILSHTIIGYITTLSLVLALLILTAFKIFTKSRIYVTAGWFILVLGLGLSSFFWLPALTEMRFTAVSSQIGAKADFHNHFVCLSQLWNSMWGFGGSVQGCVDGMSFKLGKLQILIALLGLIVWLLNKNKTKLINGYVFTGIILSLLSIFMMLSVSVSVWESIPMIAYVQYPWRFLTLTILGLAILGGFVIYFSKLQIIKWFLSIIFIASVIFINSKLFKPQYSYIREANDYAPLEEIKYRVSSISDEYLPAEIIRPINPKDIVHDTIETTDDLLVKKVTETELYGKFELESESSQYIIINRAFFPGWHFFLDGKEIYPVIRNGLPRINISPGKFILEIKFINTEVRNIANLISLMTLVVVAVSYGKNHKTIS